MNDLRPTLFLAQLSNLLAGNISIVHGVTGSSRTFMGEESAGVDAVRIAQARIAAGQSDLALVGGAYNAERWEVMLHFALAGAASIARRAERRRGSAPAWRSAPSGRSWCWRRRAMRRRAAPSRSRASRAVASDHVRRTPGAVTAALERMWATVSRGSIRRMRR